MISNKAHYIAAFALILSATAALAGDFSDYPGAFLDDGVDAVVVVGDKAPSTHVIAQTQIALYLSEASGQRTQGISKLASEVESVDQNIISIGSACINDVTAVLLGDPEPCDKDLEEGKAKLQFLEENGNSYIVLNAESDEGIKKLAGALANPLDYEITGTSFTIGVEEETGEAEKAGEEKEETAEESEEAAEEEESKEEGAVHERSSAGGKRPSKEESEETGLEGDKEPKPVIDEGSDLIRMIIGWFRSLFG